MDNMKPFDAKGKAALTLSAIDTARKLLRYAFLEVDFQYNDLTTTEQELCSQQEFDNMVRVFRLQ